MNLKFYLILLCLVLFCGDSICKRKGNGRKGKGKSNRRGPRWRAKIKVSQEIKDEVRKTKLKYKGEIDKLRTDWFKRGYRDKEIEEDQMKYVEHLRQTRKTKERARRQSPSNIGMRKEYRRLSDEERSDYHLAVWKLKHESFGNSGISKYDLLSELHTSSLAPAAHFSCVFLPWHREFLNMYEHALQEEVEGVYLPYIDTVIDSRLRDRFADSAVFDDDTLGNLQGPVTTGAFADFSPNRFCTDRGRVNTIERSVRNDWRLLYTDSDLDEYFDYDREPRDYNFLWRNNFAFERDHGGVHVSFGGHLNDLNCAACDPIFWMHHCFVDLLWEIYRIFYQTTDLETDFPTTDVPQSWLPDAPMEPFSRRRIMGDRNLTISVNPIRNIDGLSHRYLTEFYRYELNPSLFTCTDNSMCGDRLWCSNGRCVAQVRERTWCVNGDSDSCFCKDATSTPICLFGGMCTCV